MFREEISKASSGNPRGFLISFLHSVFTDTHMGHALCWTSGTQSSRRNTSGLRRLAIFRGDSRKATNPRGALT